MGMTLSQLVAFSKANAPGTDLVPYQPPAAAPEPRIATVRPPKPKPPKPKFRMPWKTAGKVAVPFAAGAIADRALSKSANVSGMTTLSDLADEVYGEEISKYNWLRGGANVVRSARNAPKPRPTGEPVRMVSTGKNTWGATTAPLKPKPTGVPKNAAPTSYFVSSGGRRKGFQASSERLKADRFHDAMGNAGARGSLHQRAWDKGYAFGAGARKATPYVLAGAGGVGLAAYGGSKLAGDEDDKVKKAESRMDALNADLGFGVAQSRRPERTLASLGRYGGSADVGENMSKAESEQDSRSRRITNTAVGVSGLTGAGSLMAEGGRQRKAAKVWDKEAVTHERASRASAQQAATLRGQTKKYRPIRSVRLKRAAKTLEQASQTAHTAAVSASRKGMSHHLRGGGATGLGVLATGVGAKNLYEAYGRPKQPKG